jgi:arylamine N-acetyltransferase
MAIMGRADFMASGDSSRNPLARPHDRELLDQFRALSGLRGEADPKHQLGELVRAFAAVPYENLTKIIKHAECHAPAASRRAPREVLRDFHRSGAGGTCFSLTATLLHLVRAMRFEAEPILADRRYGADTHCAMIVWMDDQPFLLDPGYLIEDPIPLRHAAASLVVPTRFHQLELIPHEDDRLELHTAERGTRRYRLTFKTTPVDDLAFLKAWDASFGWEMMRYPVLTRVTEHQQLYLRDTHFQKRSCTEVERENIPDEQLASRIVREFGISAKIVQQALDVLRRPVRS